MECKPSTSFWRNWRKYQRIIQQDEKGLGVYGSFSSNFSIQRGMTSIIKTPLQNVKWQTSSSSAALVDSLLSLPECISQQTWIQGSLAAAVLFYIFQWHCQRFLFCEWIKRKWWCKIYCVRCIDWLEKLGKAQLEARHALAEINMSEMERAAGSKCSLATWDFNALHHFIQVAGTVLLTTYTK